MCSLGQAAVLICDGRHTPRQPSAPGPQLDVLLRFLRMLSQLFFVCLLRLIGFSPSFLQVFLCFGKIGMAAWIKYSSQAFAQTARHHKSIQRKTRS